MVWLILGLSVTRDVDVSLRDTMMAQVSGIRSSSFGAAGEYVVNLLSSPGAVVYNGTMLNITQYEVINPLSNMAAVSSISIDPSSIEHFVIKLYDISSGGNLVGTVDIPAPSTGYSTYIYSIANCGGRICALVSFYDFSSGNGYLTAYAVDNSASASQVFEHFTTDIISRADIYGNMNMAPDTAAIVIVKNTGEALMFGVDLNLPPYSNPVISHTISGGNYNPTGGAFFEDGGSRLFASILQDLNTYDLTFLGFDLSDGTILSNTQSFNMPFSAYYVSFNSRGFCVVIDDGTDLFMYLYDIFSSSFYGDTTGSVGGIWGVFPTGYPDICSFMTGSELYAVDVDNKTFVGTSTLPTGIFSAAQPFFDDNTLPGSQVHIAAVNLDAPPNDSLFYMTYEVGYSGISLQSIDTVALEAPVALYFTDIMVYGGNLYMSKYPSMPPSRIVKAHLDYTSIWEGDTISQNNTVYLPLYVFDNTNQQMRVIDDATGMAQPYVYDIPYSTYGGPQYVKRSGSNLYILTGSYGGNLFLHQLDASDLTGSATDLGISIPYGYYDLMNDTLAIAYIDFIDQNVKLYLYDIASNTLSSPQVFDIDATTTESSGKVVLKGGYVYLPVYTSSLQKLFRCTVDFATCVNTDIDVSTYGYVIDYFVDDNGYVYLSTGNGYFSHIIALDENLNITSTAGPIPGYINKIYGMREYLMLVRSSAYTPVDTSFIMFARKSDPSVFDLVDTLVGAYGTASHVYEYSPGQYYAFFTAVERDIALARLVRYNITDATGTEEISDSRFLYQVRNGRLILQGKGDVNVRIFDITGRMVGSFNGTIDGQKTIARFPAQGIYLLDINGSKFKVVNINR